MCPPPYLLSPKVSSSLSALPQCVLYPICPPSMCPRLRNMCPSTPPSAGKLYELWERQTPLPYTYHHSSRPLSLLAFPLTLPVDSFLYSLSLSLSLTLIIHSPTHSLCISHSTRSLLITFSTRSLFISFPPCSVLINSPTRSCLLVNQLFRCLLPPCSPFGLNPTDVPSQQNGSMFIWCLALHLFVFVCISRSLSLSLYSLIKEPKPRAQVIP